MIKNYIEKLKEDLEETMKENNTLYVLDFVSDYELKDCNYLGDNYQDFADTNTSIYYSDQRNYFNEHSTECEDALLEYYDGEFLADKIKKEGLDSLLCFAGAIGEYEAIYRELADNEETIKKLLVLRHLLKYDLFDLSKDKIEEIMAACEDYNTETSELLDMINEESEAK